MYYYLAYGVVLLLGLLSLRAKYVWQELLCAVPGALIALTTTVVLYENSDRAKQQKEEYQQKQREDAVPRPYSTSIDGCTVYTFKSDRWRYFTRCEKQTTTDNSYTQSCGKNCNKTIEDDITEVNK